jgi:hypothetical protein
VTKRTSSTAMGRVLSANGEPSKGTMAVSKIGIVQPFTATSRQERCSQLLTMSVSPCRGSAG